MARRYEPPKQSGIGQFIDSIFIVALVYAAMFLPLIFGLTGGGTVTNVPETLSWENPTMAAQWEKLGYTPDSAAEIISTRFDYTIDPVWFIVTALVIGGYFLFLVRYSDKEYREVISERFE